MIFQYMNANAAVDLIDRENWAYNVVEVLTISIFPGEPPHRTNIQ